MASAAPHRPAPLPPDTAPARPDVFVSYSHDDKGFVEGTLLPWLNSQGKEVWIDLEDIPPAADWRETVLAGVSAANALLFVLSPESLTSPVCAEELARAVGLNKRVIPVVRRDLGDDAPVPPALAQPNWIWLRQEDDGEHGMAAVIEALDTDLEWRDAHSRLAVRTAEWLDHDRDRSFLLRGSDLRAAEEWLARQGDHEERATAEQTGYVLASRQATTRRQRSTLAAVAIALAIAVALAVFALVQRGQAIEGERVARSRELAASALSVLPRDPELGVLLAAEAVGTKPTHEAEDALRRSLAESHAAVTMRGHRGPVGGAVFDPSGRSVITDGHDGTVRVWDASTGRQTAVLRGHGARLIAVAVSPDGARIVSTGDDGTARVWDRDTQRVTAVLRGHEGKVFSPAFSSDGRRIVTASLDRTARLWDPRDGRQRAVLSHAGIVFNAEFDGSGRRVVTSSADGTAIVWDARRGRSQAVMTGHDGWVNRATFSPDGTLVATAGADRTARIWDSGSGDRLRVLRGHADTVNGVAFSSDSKRVVTASNDGTAAVWDVPSGRRLAELRGHLDDVIRAAFSADGRLVATAGSDNTARLWDAASGEPVALLRGHTDELGRPQFTRDGRRLLTVSDDGTARIWRVPQQPAALGGGAPLGGAALSPGGSHVLAWNEDFEARLLDTRTGRVVARFGVPGLLATGGAFLSVERLVLATQANGHAAQVRESRTGKLLVHMPGTASRTVAASRDGRRVVTLGFGEQGVEVWDAATGRRLAQLGEPDAAVTAASLSPDGARAITTSLTGTVHAWDAATGRPLGTLQHNAGVLSPGVAFSPDGGRAAVTSLDGPVPVWDLRAAKPQRVLLPRAQIPSEVVSVAWSPAGNRVAVSDRSDSGAARVFDVDTGELVAELRGHRGEVRSVSFSPDGRWLVTAGLDRTARVWEAATGRELVVLLGHRGPLVSAAFGSDGHHVLTASKDGTALVHDCAVCGSLGRLMSMVPDHVSAGRELTAAERRAFLHER
jgi:WD40 repeat protein